MPDSLFQYEYQSFIMRNFWFYTSVPLAAALAQAPAPVPGVPVCRARLESQLLGDKLTLVGQCQNESSQPLELRYEMLTDKKGPAGTSRNSQSGSFKLAPHGATKLSQTTINVSPADYYRIRLRIVDVQGSVVAEDSVVHQP